MHHLTSSNVKAIIPNYFLDGYECDLFVITKADITIEYELKKSLGDYKKDFEKQKERYNWRNLETFIKSSKHELIRTGKRTNKFYFVIPEELKDKVEVPEYAGLMVYSEYHYFKMVKRAPTLRKEKADEKIKEDIMKKLFWRLYSEIHRQLVKDENIENNVIL